MKKKVVLLIVSLGFLIGLFFVVRNLISNSGSSDTEKSELFAFAIEDTSSVDQIIIANSHLEKMVLKRGKNGWTDGTGNCIIEENIKHVMHILKNIEFKGYVAESSRKQHVKMLATSATKVEIYQDGDLSKTWYIGTATPDHYGQVMLLDSDEGKSDLPVLMKVRGLNGIIEPSFSANTKKWSCTEIMEYLIRDIKQVEVKNYDDPGRSFKIDQSNLNFKITQANNHNVPISDTSAVLRYLSGFKKVNYELPNYVLNDKQIDSLKASRPFRTLKITSNSGEKQFLKMYRIDSSEDYDAEFGEIVNHDINSFWCVLPSGEVVKCQYFVFDPLTRGDIYFPFNKALFKKQEVTEE